jgi:trans-aconitate methyltransferase
MDTWSYGEVFDSIAVEYDRERPTYPDALIDRACHDGGLSAGDRVLEIGCGTGQLTRGLVARGLSVTAVEPGQNLIALAGRASSEVQFVNSRLEDAALGTEFRGAFSAAAFHWVDPDVSWGKAARSLIPGGRLALIQYCAFHDESTAEDADEVMGALAKAAPEVAAGWPVPRDLETVMTGAEDRRDNVSDVWAWVAGQDVARGYAAALFDDVEVAALPVFVEHTPEQLNALFATTSVYHRLSPSQRNALARATTAIGERLGRPIRSVMLAVLVTARSVVQAA